MGVAEHFPKRGNLFALSDGIGGDEGGAGLIVAHKVGGFFEPTGDVIERLQITTDRENVGALSVGLIAIADKGRVADDEPDSARNDVLPIDG